MKMKKSYLRNGALATIIVFFIAGLAYGQQTSDEIPDIPESKGEVFKIEGHLLSFQDEKEVMDSRCL